MKRFLVLLMVLVGQLNAQSYRTNVTAVAIQDADGNPLASGQLCVTPTAPPGNFTAGQGAAVTNRAVCRPVVNGAIASFTVPDSLYASPQNISYAVTVTDATTGATLVQYLNVLITGATFDLDTYVPSPNILPLQYSFALRGVWLPTTQYKSDDVVSYTGSSYMAMSPSLGQEPDTNPTVWQLIAGRGPLGPLGPVAGGFSIDIPSPQTADTNLYQHKLLAPYTVTRVSCSTDVGTVTVQLDIRQESTPNTAGTNVMISPLVCNSSSAETVSFALATVTANQIVNPQILAVSGSPGVVRIHVSNLLDADNVPELFTTINAALYPGADHSIQINAALQDATAGATVDLRGFTAAQLAAHGSQTIVVNKANLTLIFPGRTFTSDACPAFDIQVSGTHFAGASSREFGAGTVIQSSAACSKGLLSNTVSTLHGADGTVLENLTLEGNNQATAGYFAPMSYSDSFHGVIAQHFTGPGLLIPSGTAQLEDVSVNNNGNDGAVLGFDGNLKGLSQANDNAGDGWHIVSGGFSIEGATAYHNKLHGVSLDGNQGLGWVSAQSYIESRIIIPDLGHNAGSYAYYSLVVGTSSSSEPAFCQSMGCTTTDGGVTWLNIGTANPYGLGNGAEFSSAGGRNSLANINSSSNNCSAPSGTCNSTGTAGLWAEIAIEGNVNHYASFNTVVGSNLFSSELPGGPQIGILCNFCSQVQLNSTVFYGGAWQSGETVQDLGAVQILNSGDVTVSTLDSYAAYGPSVTVDGPAVQTQSIVIDNLHCDTGGVAASPNPYCLYIGANSYSTHITNFNAYDYRGTPFQKCYFNSGVLTFISSYACNMSTASQIGGTVMPGSQAFGLVAGTLYWNQPAAAGYSFNIGGSEVFSVNSAGIHSAGSLSVIGAAAVGSLSVGGENLPATPGTATCPMLSGGPGGTMTWASGFTGTKTAGTCQLTIQCGVITAVSGC